MTHERQSSWEGTGLLNNFHISFSIYVIFHGTTIFIFSFNISSIQNVLYLTYTAITQVQSHLQSFTGV
jgi:hypothetical protein